MNNLVSFLKSRLDARLPGLKAQRKMEPRPLDHAFKPRRQPPSDAVASGVMLLWYPGLNNQYEIILTVRSEEIEQGGQICLPGGRVEGTESPSEAAVRETREEIGIPPDRIKFLGTLTPLYVNSSNSLIHPSVGFIPHPPAFERDPYEVQEIFTTSIETLYQSDHLAYTQWELNGRSFRVPYWNIHDTVPLWGATAMILAEFLELYEQYKNED